MIKFVKNDGGRAEAGYKGVAKDCVTRAIAIATGASYKFVYDEINRVAGKPVARSGVPKDVAEKVLKSFGFIWVATMGKGTGCKVHLNADELPKGKIVCKTSKHMCAVVDGVLHDTYDCSRNGTRCVYGYWYRPNNGVRLRLW